MKRLPAFVLATRPAANEMMISSNTATKVSRPDAEYGLHE